VSDQDMRERLIEARRALETVHPDILGVRLGWVFDESGPTDQRALIVTAPDAQAARAALPREVGGIPVEVMPPSPQDLLAATSSESEILADALDETAEPTIRYQPPPGLVLQPITGEMRVIAHVSPDAGWPTLKAFIAGAHKRMVGSMYEFDAQHVCDALLAAAGKPGFESLTLTLDRMRSGVSKPDPEPDAETMALQLGEALGARFRRAWIPTGKTGWVKANYHMKVLVRDGDAVWVSSGNWKNSGQPNADPNGNIDTLRRLLRNNNREWHAVIEHPGVAQVFEKHVLNDFDNNAEAPLDAVVLPDVWLVEDEFLADALEARAASQPPPTRNIKYFAPFDETREFTVRPLLTPNDYLPAVTEAVKGAAESILLQNQTLGAPSDKTSPRFDEFWEIVRDKQRAGLEVRLIFRLQNAGFVDWSGARAMFDALKDFGLDGQRIKVQVGCHTKGMVIDGRRVLLGSHNFSDTGVTLNRDASLLFDDKGLADYFTKIFEHDWSEVAFPLTSRNFDAPAPQVFVGDRPPPGRLAVRLDWGEVLEAL